VCFARGPFPTFAYVTDTDRSDDLHYCVPLKTLELGAKIAYYVIKGIEQIAKNPVPPAP
jgi:hypothetical protein